MAQFEKQIDGSLIRRFKVAADKVTVLLKDFVQIKPYHNPELLVLSTLSEQKQRGAVHQLETYLETLESVVANDEKVSNNSQALWRALNRFGLRPPSDFFAELEADDCIEIYDLKGIQIWRNINVFKICSYTIEEIHAYEWPERYERDAADTERCFGIVGKVLAMKEPGVIFGDIANHVVKENFSEKRFELDVRHDYFCPFFDDNNQLAAWAVTSKVDILHQHASIYESDVPANMLEESVRPHLELL